MLWPLHFRAGLVPVTAGSGASGWFPHVAALRRVLIRDPWSRHTGPWTPWVKAAPSRFLGAQMGRLCHFLRPFLPWTMQPAGSGDRHLRKGPWGCLLRWALPQTRSPCTSWQAVTPVLCFWLWLASSGGTGPVLPGGRRGRELLPDSSPVPGQTPPGLMGDTSVLGSLWAAVTG